MLSIAGDLEDIGDIYFQMSKTLERKKEGKIYFIPKQRNNILKMIENVDSAFLTMVSNLEKGPIKVSVNEAIEKEKVINEFRDKLRNAHLKSVEKNDYSIQSGLIYSDLYSSLEKVGDHIINVSEGINGQV